MAQVVDTMARLYGDDRNKLVDFVPQPAVEALFGRYPKLASRALVLRDDGSPAALVQGALATPALS